MRVCEHFISSNLVVERLEKKPFWTLYSQSLRKLDLLLRKQPSNVDGFVFVNKIMYFHFQCRVNYLHFTVNIQQGAGRDHFYISQSTFDGLVCHTAVPLIGIFLSHYCHYVNGSKYPQT